MNSLDVELASAAVAVAPRVTLEALNARVSSEQYLIVDGILTICVLKMANGFYITGESAPASPENYNAELGQQFAREQAIRKAWAFEGYSLRDRLAATDLVAVMSDLKDAGVEQ